MGSCFNVILSLANNSWIQFILHKMMISFEHEILLYQIQTFWSQLPVTSARKENKLCLYEITYCCKLKEQFQAFFFSRFFFFSPQTQTYSSISRSSSRPSFFRNQRSNQELFLQQFSLIFFLYLYNLLRQSCFTELRSLDSIFCISYCFLAVWYA